MNQEDNLTIPPTFECVMGKVYNEPWATQASPLIPFPLQDSLQRRLQRTMGDASVPTLHPTTPAPTTEASGTQ